MQKTDAKRTQSLDDPTGRIYYRRSDLFHEALGTVILLLIVFCMFCAVFWLGTHYAKPVNGASMQPNINNYAIPTGDIAIVSSTSTYSQSNIIIVDMTRSQNTDSQIQGRLLIKRVIALPGDSLRLVADGAKYYFELKKNGTDTFERLDETYANPMTSPERASAFHSQSGWTVKITPNSDGSVTLPQNYMFFVGDNRNGSYDCRNFGPVETDACVGVVESILYKDSFWNRLFGAIGSLFNIGHTEAYTRD